MLRKVLWISQIFIFSYAALLLIDALWYPPRVEFLQIYNEEVTPKTLLSETSRPPSLREFERWPIPVLPSSAPYWGDWGSWGNGPLFYNSEYSHPISLPWMVARIATTLFAIALFLWILNLIRNRLAKPRGFEVILSGPFFPAATHGTPGRHTRESGAPYHSTDPAPH